MVAYLKKPTGSEGFQEIVDFLNGSHIRYALTKNPSIYVSIIEKFWQTATVRTVDNGEQEINATVDGKDLTITEASVRGFSEEHTPLFPSMLALQAEEGEDEAVHQERGDSVERAATTATSLEAVQDSNMVFALETDLRQTKKVYGTAYTKLIMKVKKLEKTVQTSQARRRAKIVVLDDDMASDDSSKQGRMIEEIDQDVGVTLMHANEVHTYSRRRRAVSTGSGGVSTASRIVSTSDMIQQVNIIILSSSATKEKGKAIMTESEPEQTTTKLKQDKKELAMKHL
ncbi:hypothetical protein Tco_0759226 [Tanacetum coccineum]